MKRDEMIEFICDEIKDSLNMRQYSGETDEKYWKRKSAQILDMIEGFGMLPPPRMRYIETENGNTLCSEDCSWECEDDLK